MDTATNIIFRSLTAVYNGTISGDSLYPSLYFSEIHKKNTFYGFRLHDIIPTRLILRIYEDGKKIVTDMLWLVDNTKFITRGLVFFSEKSKSIEVDGKPKDLISLINSDATINACYTDLVILPDFFDKVVVTTKDTELSKILTEANVKCNNIPTELYAFSRIKLNAKDTNDEYYQDIAINSYLALIDLIHRTLELLSKHSQKENGELVFCVRCGQTLPSSSVYCPICGSKQN